MYLLKEFYGKLPNEKIRSNWDKRPIKMEKFLSFLTVKTTRSTDHLGRENGWTRHDNEEFKLYIGGGIVKGVEYLDNIKFGEKLANPCNNFVNPFWLHEIMTKDGLDFFLGYYDDEIKKRIKELELKIKATTDRLNGLNDFHKKIMKSIDGRHV
jgi:hypothetical protein